MENGIILATILRTVAGAAYLGQKAGAYIPNLTKS